jgi:hypothetical protein
MEMCPRERAFFGIVACVFLGGLSGRYGSSYQTVLSHYAKTA